MHSIRAMVFSRLILVLTVFFGLVGGLAYLLTRTVLTQFFLEDHARMVGFITRNIQSNFQADLAALDELAKMEGLAPFDERKAGRLLEDFLRFDNVFGSVRVYRTDGALLLNRRRDSIRPYRSEDNFHKKWDKNFIDVALEVIATGKPRVTQTIRRTKGDLFQAYLVPLASPPSGRAPGRVFGLLSGAIFYRKGELNYLIKGLRLDPKNFVLLTDTRGDILAEDGVDDERYPKLLAPEIQQASEQLFGTAAPARGAAAPARGAAAPTRGVAAPTRGVAAPARRPPLYTATLPLGKGTAYTIFSSAIEGLELTLTMGATREAIQHKERLLLKWLFAGMVGGLVLCFFASMLVAGRLAKPFGLLTAAAKSIDEGDFSARIGYDGADEIGALCSLMNRLARKIDKGRLLGQLWLDEPD